MLIATLPAVHHEQLIRKIISHPLVNGVRYNAGVRSTSSPTETVEFLAELCRLCGKKLWIDLKGRQLRITKWAMPDYGIIEVNHPFTVDLPAKVFFRNDQACDLVEVRGNIIFVDPNPPEAVGDGQAINVVGSNLQIEGFLTAEDEEYVLAAKELEVNDLMLSFVECGQDILDVRSLNPEANLVLKIESLPGMAFISSAEFAAFNNSQLMAARDDLMINIGLNKVAMLAALEKIVMIDPTAILASRLFTSLEKQTLVSLADFCDLQLMEMMGYANFMFSDGLCRYHFDQAMQAWQDYQAAIAEGV